MLISLVSEVVGDIRPIESVVIGKEFFPVVIEELKAPLGQSPVGQRDAPRELCILIVPVENLCDIELGLGLVVSSLCHQRRKKGR